MQVWCKCYDSSVCLSVTLVQCIKTAEGIKPVFDEMKNTAFGMSFIVFKGYRDTGPRKISNTHLCHNLAQNQDFAIFWLFLSSQRCSAHCSPVVTIWWQWTSEFVDSTWLSQLQTEMTITTSLQTDVINCQIELTSKKILKGYRALHYFSDSRACYLPVAENKKFWFSQLI